MKLAASLFIAVIAIGLIFTFDVASPELSTQAALDQMDVTSNAGAVEIRAVSRINQIPTMIGIGAAILIALIYSKEIMNSFKKLRTAAAAALLLIPVTFTGCMRPYDVPEFEEIGTSETAFLVPLEGNMKDQKSLDVNDLDVVQAKRVQITHRWVSTGRLGEYVDTVRLIKVDRAPVTVRLDDAIAVESKDSVGFSTGLSVTGRIPGDKEAKLFLHNYPGDSLQGVLNDEFVQKCLGIMSREAAQYDMDDLRARKNEIDTAIEADVVPFFAERGIEITNVSIWGGYTYENPEIQKSIDKVFAAQQDKNVAIAEFEAAEQRKAALKAEGEGEAAKVLEAARGKAEGIKLVADAKAYEISQLEQDPESYLKLKDLEIEKLRTERWDGRYPYYFMTTGEGGNGPDLLMNVPAPPQAEVTN